MAKFLFSYFNNLESIVKDGNPIGGSAVQTLVWMKALHQLGHEVYQATYIGDERPLLEDYRWVRKIPVYDKSKFKGAFVWFTYRFPSYYFALKNFKVDYFYISMPHWTIYFTGLICRVLGIKQIIRIANDKNIDRKLSHDGTRIQNYFQDRGLKSSFLVLAQNQYQFGSLIGKFKIKNVKKISNPIVIDQDYLVEKVEFEGFIAWLANFRHQKNLKLLFSIACELSDEIFKIAGQPLHPMDEESEEYYQKLQRLENVEFVGILKRDDVLGFLKKAKFLLSTSRYEGFSNTFLESMVTGTPILTTYNVNPDGIINEFDLGYLYTDHQDLTEILRNISKADYLKKSKNCIEYVKDKHDHIRLGEKLLDFLAVS